MILGVRSVKIEHADEYIRHMEEMTRLYLAKGPEGIRWSRLFRQLAKLLR